MAKGSDKYTATGGPFMAKLLVSGVTIPSLTFLAVRDSIGTVANGGNRAVNERRFKIPFPHM